MKMACGHFLDNHKKRLHLGHAHCSKPSSSALLREDEEAEIVRFLCTLARRRPQCKTQLSSPSSSSKTWTTLVMRRTTGTFHLTFCSQNNCDPGRTRDYYATGHLSHNPQDSILLVMLWHEGEHWVPIHISGCSSCWNHQREGMMRLNQKSWMSRTDQSHKIISERRSNLARQGMYVSRYHTIAREVISVLQTLLPICVGTSTR